MALSLTYLKWCLESIAGISRFLGIQSDSVHRSRHWLTAIFFAAASFWQAEARAQITNSVQLSPGFVLDGEVALAEASINDISSRLDFANLPVPSSAGRSGSNDVIREVAPSPTDARVTARFGTALAPAPKPRFQTRSALRQEFEYLMVEHSFRVSQDPGLRFQLAHSPFFHDWFVSFKGYDLKRWGDGDDFLVNDIAHPMQGAIASAIFLQNSPVGSTRVIGKDPRYWTSRLKGMAWAAAFEVQWKIGPLSETSLGNAGGWKYVPDCGITPNCINNPNYPPPTNNTGLSDWIVTPVVGTGWVMLEDLIDKYVVGKVGERSRVGAMILKSSLEPCKNFAALFAGMAPWTPRTVERFTNYKSISSSSGSIEGKAPWKTNRRSVGVQFVNVSLPGARSSCLGCRENHLGIGFPYGARLFEHVSFDSELNYFPSGTRKGDPSLEALFGAKIGSQTKKWGLFGKVRPGLIYYQNAWSGGSSAHFTDLSRFALDAGGVFEVYPSARSTLRIDVGTTLVRYLRDYPNPRISPLGSIISTDYYVTQGNFQFSTGYRIRF